MTKPRTILTLAAIFLAGAASALLLGWGLDPHRRRIPGTREIMAGTFERIDRELHLDPAQRTRIEAAMTAASSDLATMRRDLWRKGAERIQALNAEIAGLLTPEQQVRFAQIQREQEERLRHRQQERDRRFPGPGGPPPPPPEGMGPPPPPRE